MRFEEVMLLIKNLAKSQGFYGRMLNAIEDMDANALKKFKKFIEENNFKDSVEFVMFVEGGF